MLSRAPPKLTSLIQLAYEHVFGDNVERVAATAPNSCGHMHFNAVPALHRTRALSIQIRFGHTTFDRHKMAQLLLAADKYCNCVDHSLHIFSKITSKPNTFYLRQTVEYSARPHSLCAGILHFLCDYHSEFVPAKAALQTA